MSLWPSPEAKRNFFKLAYGGSLKEGELAVDCIPLNFQKGEKSRIPFPGEYPGDMHHGPEVRHIGVPRKMCLTSPETLDFKKVELRVTASLPELSDEDLELSRKLKPLITEIIIFEVMRRLGLKPDAFDADFAVVNDSMLPEVRRGR